MRAAPWYDTWRGAAKHTFWSDRRLIIVGVSGVLLQLVIRIWELLT